MRGVAGKGEVLRFCGFFSENWMPALQKEVESEENVQLDRI